MTDVLGGLVIPTVKVSPDLAGDPLVSRLLRFLLCALVTDGALREAWKEVCREDQPIRKGFFHDPEDDHLGQPGPNDLPALFLYRHEIQAESTFVASWSLRKSVLHLRYVFAPAEPTIQTDRVGIPNAIASCVTSALYSGRTPSFRVANDPDLQAAELGSFMPPFAGIARLRVGKTERKPMKLRRPKGQNQPGSMMSTVTEIVIEERLRRMVDPAVHYDMLVGGEVQILSSDPPTLVTEDASLVTGFSSLSPATGPAAGGTTVALRGTYLVDPAIVLFGGVEAPDLVVDSFAQITCKTPTHGAGVVDVTLINGDGVTVVLPNGFTFT